ncbi:MAG: hypothetical protein HY921_01540 [Elusimicrobia bacterium]|nr:hypothetical protein [Elusimicrobiota bacterium]
MDGQIREKLLTRFKSKPADPESLAQAGWEILREALSQGGSGETAALVCEICREVINAALVLEKSPPDTAVQLLKQTSSIADENGLDPTTLVNWVLEGVACATLRLGVAARNQMIDSIEENFLGGGAAFKEICRKLPENP